MLAYIFLCYLTLEVVWPIVLCLLDLTVSLQTMSQNKSTLKLLCQVFFHSGVKVTIALLNFKTPSIKELMSIFRNLVWFHTLLFNHVWLPITFMLFIIVCTSVCAWTECGICVWSHVPQCMCRVFLKSLCF